LKFQETTNERSALCYWFHTVSDRRRQLCGRQSRPRNTINGAASGVDLAEPEPKEEPNTTTPSQAESVLAAEKRALEMMASDANLSEVLNDLCAVIDAHAPPATSMVCLMDPDGKQLLPGAGTHVSVAFTRAITPWPLGPERGACGTAAFTKERVIIANVSKDPRWPDEARDLALMHGFCAAWSEPLISKDSEVLGTFCVSYAEPRIPNNRDIELIQAAGHFALIAIEFEKSRQALTKESESADILCIFSNIRSTCKGYYFDGQRME
jgi:hypothetical protein